MRQDLPLSLFGLFSPSDYDAYLRPMAFYRLDDHWTITLGANVFAGRQPTSFGQLRDNTNACMP